jgi:hypothetical protein
MLAGSGHALPPELQVQMEEMAALTIGVEFFDLKHF